MNIFSIDNQIKIIPVNFDNSNLYTSYHPFNKLKQSNVPKYNYTVNQNKYSGHQSNNIGVPKSVVPIITAFI